MAARGPTVKKLLEFCERSELEVKVVEGSDRSLIDRILGRDNRFMKDSVYLAKNPDRFEILEESEGNFNGFSDKAIGKFLGYPEEAIEYYSKKKEGEPAGKEFKNKIQEMTQKGELTQEDIIRLNLISYIPPPKENNIEKTLKKARKREEKLKNFQIGKKILDQIKQKEKVTNNP